MNAIEFVREHGLGMAREVICRTYAPYAKAVIIYEGRPSYSVSMSYGWTLISEIEKLVDAVDLIKSYKGCGKPKETALETAKFTLIHLRGTRQLEIQLFGNNDRELILEKAINLVEQCNAKS